MPDHLLYLAINAGVLVLPFLFSFHPRIQFYKHWSAFLKSCLLTMIPFIIWDIAFTESGIWGFNPQYVSGIDLLGLPLEEWMFFICIPYACVFTYYCFGLLHQMRTPKIAFHLLSLVSAMFALIAIVWCDRAYTFLTFLLTGFVLGYLSLIKKPVWLQRSVLTYLAILPFFFASNGLLTGSWIHDEVVWYNNTENLGIRLGTIPIEDGVYGFLLVLLNMMLFQRWKK